MTFTWLTNDLAVSDDWVVTADRGLAERVRAANAEVVGPSWLLDKLVE
jgi:hypothetical protein